MNIIRCQETSVRKPSQPSQKLDPIEPTPLSTKTSLFHPFNKYTFTKKRPPQAYAEGLLFNQNDRAVDTGHIQDF